MELTYKDGKGSYSAVVYEVATEREDSMHKIRQADGTSIVVDESRLLKLHQPDLTNIPSTPLDYQQEIKNGYLPAEDAKILAHQRMLSPIQQLLMDWHHRLYHLQIRRMFMLADKGFLPKILLKCKDNVPKCVACEFGTAHRRPWRLKGKQSGSIRNEKQVKPGGGQSIDQIVSSQPGLIPQMAGFLTSERYYGATTIVDHVTDYVYVHLMRNLTLEETIKAKRSWEKILHDAGHTVKHYQADNGRFADKGFQDDCTAHDQTISYCGVGAHHQNGIVENKNKILTQGARTMLLHGIRMWPAMITTMFWPFALKAMAERLNRLHIHPDGSTPESRLYGTCGVIPVGSYHTLFCPVYVLDARSQNEGAMGPPKWDPKARIGIYLCHSPFHAGSVALVLNPTTGLVSPQFHVVFDDNFSTVPFMIKGQVPDNWGYLYRYSRELATEQKFDLAKSWFRTQCEVPDIGSVKLNANPFEEAQRPPKDGELLLGNRNVRPSSSAGEVLFATDFLESDYEGESGIREQEDLSSSSDHEGTRAILPSADTDLLRAEADQNDPSQQLQMPTCINLHDSGLRRSVRIQELNKNKRRNADGTSTKKKNGAHVAFGTVTRKVAWLGGIYALFTTVQMPNHPLPDNPSVASRIVNKFHECNELFDGTINHLHNFALATDLSNNEVFTLSQAMRQDDRDKFIEAMKKEVKDHEEREHWELVLRSTIPKSARVIQPYGP